MLASFRSYQLALRFYREVSTLRLPSHLKSQLLRAASSVALCLADCGAGSTQNRQTIKSYETALARRRKNVVYSW